jgi:hypothetical protein
MSAFIVTDSHINALVRYASRHNIRVFYGATLQCHAVRESEQSTADILLNENVKSVNYRYNENDNASIVYDYKAPLLTPIEAIKAAQCLRYQSCEHNDYEQSIASKIIEAIIVDAIPRIDGYDKAAWCIENRIEVNHA